jgi:hypothetical protein
MSVKLMKPGVVESLQAQANLVKHRFIGFDGNYCVADAKSLGVSQTDTEQLQQCPVIVTGIALIESGEAINAGNPLVAGTDGVALVAASLAVSVAVPAGATPVTSDAAQPDLTETITGSVTPQAINGYALDDASDAGEIIRVLVA